MAAYYISNDKSLLNSKKICALLSECFWSKNIPVEENTGVRPDIHGIEGQIYCFYYKLAFELDIAKSLNQNSHSLPKGTLILLHSIIKYNMQSLRQGIEASGLFKVKYDPSYHQVVDTSNGTREYAIFSAYLEG